MGGADASVRRRAGGMIAIADDDWPGSPQPGWQQTRSPALAARLIALLPTRPRMVGLGSDTANLFQFLAPMIARAQAWTLLDADEARLGDAFRRTADWAERHGWTVTWPGRALVVHTPSGAWRMEGIVQDAMGGAVARFGVQPDAVVSDALLHCVSAGAVGRFARSARCPLLACLTRTGRDVWMPRDPSDAIIAAGLRHRRNGAETGWSTPAQVMRALGERGFTTRSEISDWLLPRAASPTVATLVLRASAAARIALPSRRPTIAAWEERRLRQTRLGRLAIRIGHRDILAVPR